MIRYWWKRNFDSEQLDIKTTHLGEAPSTSLPLGLITDFVLHRRTGDRYGSAQSIPIQALRP